MLHNMFLKTDVLQRLSTIFYAPKVPLSKLQQDFGLYSGKGQIRAGSDMAEMARLPLLLLLSGLGRQI